MTPTEIAVVSAIVPLIIALTAWLRAETANKAAKTANANAVVAIRTVQKTKAS
jgi:hypothetical protein